LLTALELPGLRPLMIMAQYTDLDQAAAIALSARNQP